MESHCLVRSLCSCLWWLLQLFVRIQIKSSGPKGPNVSLMLVNHFELWHFGIICHLKIIGLDKFVAWTSNQHASPWAIQTIIKTEPLKELRRKFSGPQLPPELFFAKRQHGLADSPCVCTRVNPNPFHQLPRIFFPRNPRLCLVVFHLPTPPGKLFGEKLLKSVKDCFR